MCFNSSAVASRMTFCAPRPSIMISRWRAETSAPSTLARAPSRSASAAVRNAAASVAPPTNVVTAFCKLRSNPDPDVIMTHFTEDAVYHNIPMALAASVVRLTRGG
jgi:hypothetical protein